MTDVITETEKGLIHEYYHDRRNEIIYVRPGATTVIRHGLPDRVREILALLKVR
ncbi:MAG: hypothetical protein QXT14_06365 [Candidatus Bathyarchaeia archaeon]